MHAVIFCITLIGFVAACLASSRQQERLFDCMIHVAAQELLRLFACFSFCAAFVYAVHEAGWSFGTVIWFGHLSLSAGVVFISLILFDRLSTGSSSAP
jgi:hypothetical protein